MQISGISWMSEQMIFERFFTFKELKQIKTLYNNDFVKN